VIKWSFEKSNGKPITKRNSYTGAFWLAPLSNEKYTWSSFCGQPAMTLKDRFLVFGPCIDRFNIALGKRVPHITSDHYLILMTFGHQRWGLNMWMWHHSFEPLLRRKQQLRYYPKMALVWSWIVIVSSNLLYFLQKVIHQGSR